MSHSSVDSTLCTVAGRSPASVRSPSEAEARAALAASRPTKLEASSTALSSAGTLLRSTPVSLSERFLRESSSERTSRTLLASSLRGEGSRPSRSSHLEQASNSHAASSSPLARRSLKDETLLSAARAERSQDEAADPSPGKKASAKFARAVRPSAIRVEGGGKI